ncbi:MAG: dapE 2 [Microbacterium sp.]|nr:dapE 2 [Microbacterium sp.]
MPELDLSLSSVELTRIICDVPSVSGDETTLADLIADAVGALPHLDLYRDGDTIVARTDGGRDQRVVIAGHIDTVPVNHNLPTRLVDIDGVPSLWGRGTVDMKAGVAVQLRLAAELTDPRADITWMWYDHEEVDADLNGLTRLSRTRPDLLSGDFAILGEPSNGRVEGGCNGNLRVIVRTRGVRAHSARSWVGENAVHAAAPVLSRLAEYRRPGLDAPLAREFLAAVGGEPRPKYGWTDVARFSALGVPAVNYGPGDPSLAHHDEEAVPLAQIEDVERGLRTWLSR